MEHIQRSQEIYKRAAAEHQPAATVVMLSGGDDSLTTLFLAIELGINIDYIIHGNTGTGLPEATDFVRGVAKSTGIPYAEADATGVFEKYVMRKGFIGRGRQAHPIAYHLLKATGFRKAISRNLRKGKRNYKVLCLNGVRIEESANRADNYAADVTRSDPASKNDVWLNLIHYWTQEQCLAYLEGIGVKRSPVSKCLGRSGECMCGTMQGTVDRMAAAKFNPEWGRWIDKLESKVTRKFPWGWSEPVPKSWNMEKNGQGNLFTGYAPQFIPACSGCKSLN